MPFHHPDRDYGEILSEDQEAIVLADRLGFTEAFVGEHFSSLSERITSPLIFLATLIPRTDADPVRHGRHQPAAAPSRDGGGARGDVRPPVPRALHHGHRPRRARERPRDVRRRPGRAAAADGASSRSTRSSSCGARTRPTTSTGGSGRSTLRTASGPSSRWAGSRGPTSSRIRRSRCRSSRRTRRARRRPGERGWIPISGQFFHRRYLRGHWEKYAEGCEAAGRRPDPSVWRVSRSVLVTETDAEAEDYLADPETGLVYYYRSSTSASATRRKALFMLKPGPRRAGRGRHGRHDQARR